MKTVIVNGTFDILHIGHLALLEFAKNQGDTLLVCIDSDARVKRLKGKSRPINTQYERAAMLAALRDVDEVKVFDTDQDLIDFIKKSDIMIKGSDYVGQPIVGEEYCKEIRFFERIDGYSTTKKIQYITDRR
jgi:D-beta-D-heptose 7-phosphate kinase/D-beta-D-heptose 1-phosphate adenosyltransferase